MTAIVILSVIFIGLWNWALNWELNNKELRHQKFIKDIDEAFEREEIDSETRMRRINQEIKIISEERQRKYYEKIIGSLGCIILACFLHLSTIGAL